MRKRIFIAMLAVFAAVIGVVVLRELFSNEPKYRGKTASAWLKGYYLSEGSLDRRKEAAEALRQMGPDGIRFLVNQFYSTNIHSSLRTNIHTFLAKLPLLHFPEYVSPEFVSWRAGDMIIEVHPTADVLLPLLRNRLHSTDEGERLKAVYVLGFLGIGAEEMMPILRQTLQSTNLQDRELAAYSLLQLGKAAQPAVPELVNLIAQDRFGKRLGYDSITAFKVLNQLGPPASNAVPVLQGRFADETRIPARLMLAETICHIDAQATNAFQFILDVVKDKTNGFSYDALERLGKIAMYANIAAPALSELVEEKDGLPWLPTASSLVGLGATNLAMTLVNKRLASNDPNSRIEAAIFVLQYEPNNAQAISILLALLRDHDWSGVVLSKLPRLSYTPEPIWSLVKEVLREGTNSDESVSNARAEMIFRYLTPPPTNADSAIR